jgi:CRISPR system Cascade subunit CasB
VLAGKAGSEEAVERRFVALLNAHPEDLDKHLRHAVSLLKAHEIPVDWLRLLGDLRGWGNPERYVQRNWARAFWGGRQDADTTEAQAGPSESGNDD